MLIVPIECDQRSPEYLISGPVPPCAILSRTLTAQSGRRTVGLVVKGLARRQSYTRFTFVFKLLRN